MSAQPIFDKVLNFFISFWFVFVPLIVILKMAEMVLVQGLGESFEIWMDTMWDIRYFTTMFLLVTPGIAAIWIREKVRERRRNLSKG